MIIELCTLTSAKVQFRVQTEAVELESRPITLSTIRDF